MQKKNNTTVVLKILGGGIVIVQLLDIMIHAVTNQLEPLRVSSNIVVLLWLAIMASARFNTKTLLMAVLSIVVYSILNIVFLALEGVTNAEQGGELRVALFLLVFITVTLSSLLAYIHRKTMIN